MQAASRAAAADTVYTFTPEDVQRGADLPDLTELTDAEKVQPCLRRVLGCLASLSTMQAARSLGMDAEKQLLHQICAGLPCIIEHNAGSQISQGL